MLSGETSIGSYPVESVKIMARIIERTEEVALDQIPPLKHSPATKGGAITKAATEVGSTVGAKFLVAPLRLVLLLEQNFWLLLHKVEIRQDVCLGFVHQFLCWH